MDYEIRDCIDAGSEYCPCPLSETGDCILCSHLCNTSFCDCKNWRGVCIYNDFLNNNSKAKELRKTFSCKIVEKNLISTDLVIFKIQVLGSLASKLVNPGSFVFIRNPKSGTYYDVPISIMECDTSSNIITLAIEIKGIKTKTLNELNIDDEILIRGPYWNGVLGIKNVNKLRDKKILSICRGIGFAPLIPVIKRLYSQGNEIILLLDLATMKFGEVYKLLNKYDIKTIEINSLDNGELTAELKSNINEILKTNEISLIHIDGPDILISDVIDFLGDTYKYSCCNNAKMCCGEGICGTCSTRYEGKVVKKLCKVQIDPKYIFEGRRFL